MPTHSYSSPGIYAVTLTVTDGLGLSSTPATTTATITAVVGPALTSITVTAASPTVAAGSTDQFAATGHYSAGSTQDLTNAANWNSSNTNAASISNTAGAQGLATGRNAGSTNITASLTSVISDPYPLIVTSSPRFPLT